MEHLETAGIFWVDRLCPAHIKSFDAAFNWNSEEQESRHWCFGQI
jgi:hypothetical protein